MIESATTLRLLKVAGAIAICGMVGVLSTLNTGASHGTLPDPIVSFEPGDSARQLVLTWDDPPDMPTGCTFRGFSTTFGKTGGPSEDEMHVDGSGGSSYSINSLNYWSNNINKFATHNFVAGQNYWGSLAYYADCTGHDRRLNTHKTITTKAPHSGPATGFTATAGSAAGSIALSWTNPASATVTKNEYRTKLSSGSTWSSWTATSGAGTSVTISSLTAGSNYDIQFRVFTSGVRTKTLQASSVGAGAATSVGSVGSLNAASGTANGAVNLTWGNAENATAYQYQMKKNSSNTWGSWTSAGTSTSKTISGLDAGVLYDFKVRGTAASIHGAESSVASAVAQFTPTATAAAGATTGTIKVAITAPAGLTVTKYELRWKLASDAAYPTSGTGSWASIGTGTTHNITGLTASTSHNMELRAVHSTGDAASTNSLAKSLTATSKERPGPPTGFSAAQGDAPGEIDITWTDPAGLTVTARQYRTKLATDAGFTGSWSSTSGSSPYTITGLNANTAYGVELRIGANGGYSTSVTASATAGIVPTPTNVSATQGDAPGEIDLSWTDPAGTTLTARQYRIRLDTEPTFTGSWTATGATSPITITGLEANTEHDLQVRVQATAGYSASVVASATSGIVPTPTGLTASQGDDVGEIDVEWTAPSGITVSEYRYRTKKTADAEYPNNWETADATTTSVTLPGHMGNVEHLIQLAAATRITGRSADSYSEPATATARAKPIPPPTSPKALESDTPGVALLQWVPPPQIETHEFRFRFKSQQSRFSEWSQWQTSPGDQTSVEVLGLQPGTPYTFQVMANNDGLGGSAPQEFTLQLIPAASPTGLQAIGGRSFMTVQWDTPLTGEIIGHRYRYRKTNDDPNLPTSWTDWTHRDLTETDTQSVTIFGLPQATEYTVELVGQRGNTFSQAVSASTSTWLNVPLVSEIAPVIESHRVSAGSAVALVADVFDQQGGNVNAAIDANTGLFQGVHTVYEWTDVRGAGRFRDSADGRRVVYEVPDTGGQYTITVRILPTGICATDHQPNVQTDPCTTQFTVNVDRSGNAPVVIIPPAIDTPNDNTNFPNLPTPVVSIDTGTTQEEGTPTETGTGTTQQEGNPTETGIGDGGDLPDTGGATPPNWLILAGILSLLLAGGLFILQRAAGIPTQRRTHR